VPGVERPRPGTGSQPSLPKTQHPTPKATPVIIDTDPGVDDALALLLAGASPELDVLAVTTVGGNAGLDRTTENARRIVPVAWQDRPRPPIYRGAAGAIYRGAAGALEGADFIHGADGLGGASGLFPPTIPLAGGYAAGALVDLATSWPDQITLIALGPLTNLAAALRHDPEVLRLFRRIVVMGGAFREPGNASPVAEYNIWADPVAAQAVCDAGVPLIWVPLDVTHRCLLTAAQLAALPDTPRARMARAVSEFYIDFHARERALPGCYLHDPLAIAAVIWPELLQSRPMRVDVETRGDHTSGMTVADFRPGTFEAPRSPNADVCLEVDADRFLERFLARLAA
jgi:inosine-uridine nucleoside N-ribohydrolase